MPDTTLLILAGPSCVGKGPLLSALRRCHPELPFRQPVVHTSRAPRPGEQDGVDFHFRDAEAIRDCDPERYFVYEMRNQMRAIDLAELGELASAEERVIVELNPPKLPQLLEHPRLRAMAERSRVVTVLVQPLAVAEAESLALAQGVPPEDAVTDVMLPLQIRRSERMGKPLTRSEIEDLLIRSQAAWAEMTATAGFEHALVNHDPEGHEHWDLTPPIGDAGRTLAAVAELLGATTA